jgi:hypothetical protein
MRLIEVSSRTKHAYEFKNYNLIIILKDKINTSDPQMFLKICKSSMNIN